MEYHPLSSAATTHKHLKMDQTFKWWKLEIPILGLWCFIILIFLTTISNLKIQTHISYTNPNFLTFTCQRETFWSTWAIWPTFSRSLTSPRYGMILQNLRSIAITDKEAHVSLNRLAITFWQSTSTTKKKYKLSTLVTILTGLLLTLTFHLTNCWFLGTK